MTTDPPIPLAQTASSVLSPQGREKDLHEKLTLLYVCVFDRLCAHVKANVGEQMRYLLITADRFI